MIAQDMKDDARELSTAGQYEHNLTSKMVDNFLEGGGRDHNLYRHNLLDLSRKVESNLLRIGYMDRTGADAHMAQELLTADDVCEFAEKRYRKLKDKGQWAMGNGPQLDLLFATPSVLLLPLAMLP